MAMTLENYMIPCLTKTLFGVECFGCGFQRSLVLLIKGQFAEAFWMYPAVYPMLIFGFLVVISKFYPFKYQQQSIQIFGILSVVTIVTNFIIKQFIL
jgi:hypothetical protein